MRGEPSLMTAVAAHNDELAIIVEHHGEAIRQLCSRRLGPTHDVDDAVQEVLLRAWGALPSYDPTRPMWPWLATIAGNVCIDLTRRQQVDERRRGRDLVVVLPDERPEDHERDQIVREAMARLPNPAATALYLREVEGWDYEQIGAHLNRKPGAARTAVTRARHQLRTHLETIARSKGQWPLSLALGPLWARRRHPFHQVRSTRFAEMAHSMTMHAVEVAVAAGVLLGATATTSSPHPPVPPRAVAAAPASAPSDGSATGGHGPSARPVDPAPDGATYLSGPGDGASLSSPAVEPPLEDGLPIDQNGLPLPTVPDLPEVQLRAPDTSDPGSVVDAADLPVDPPDDLPAP